MIFKGARRLGMMGGTFNPIHLGHLRAAEEITEFLQLDRLIFMPSAFPPHKPGQNLADFSDRLKMVSLAVAGHSAFRVSDLEYNLPKPSYTANTLRIVADRVDSGCQLFFLVGFDSFRTVGEWYDHADLLKLACFVVFRRPGLGSALNTVQSVLQKFLKTAPRAETDPSGRGGALWFPGCLPVYYYSGCQLEISSTDLRNRLIKGRSVRYLVPDSVREHIVQNALYLDPSYCANGGNNESKGKGV